jgi:YD repeat-containing protein
MGNTTKVYMNDYGNPLKIEDPNNYYIEKKYDTDFNVIKHTDKANKNHTYTYHNYTEGSNYKTYGCINMTTYPTNTFTVHSWSFQNDEVNFIAYLSKVINKNEYSTEYTYDNYYNLATIMDASNNMSAMYYDTYGNMISYHDFRGFVTNYSYDRYANLLNITDPGGNVTRNSYDQKNRLKNITDARGFVTTYEYDDLDRITKITDALGNSTQYIYDEVCFGHYSTGIQSEYHIGIPIEPFSPYKVYMPSSIKYPDGFQINLTLNHTIKRIEMIEESSGSSYRKMTFNYDSMGNLVKFSDANNYSTSYNYDALNRVIKETDARGNYTTYTYDPNGNLGAVTNRRGYSTVYMYDSLNRKTREIDATGNTTYYTYDSEGNLKTVKNAKGFTTTYYYDVLNRRTQIKNTLNHSTYYTYDENGNKKTDTDPNGKTITHYYDALNRLIKTKNAMNLETIYDFDSMGNVLNITDANGNKTKYSYDALNREISITNPKNNITYYSYDSMNNLLNITDANNHLTKYEYDDFRRLKKVIYPSGNQTQGSYDNVDNLIQRKDAKGLITNYTYDELNRLVKVTYPDNSDITYQNDELGNIIKVMNNASFIENTDCNYDALNRIISIKVNYGSFNKTINYTYDEVGNRITMTDPEGNITYYSMDALNNVINITGPGQKTYLFHYDNANKRTSLDYPNGAYANYTYDNANRITTIWHKNSSGVVIAKYSYIYDNVGNIINSTENDENFTTYLYDNIYKLKNVSFPDGSWAAYTYDGVGNRLTSKNNSTTIYYSYDEDNRVMVAGSITFKHDKNGNLINRTEGNNITLYEYDYNNKLTKLILPDSSSVTYNISALGDYIKRTNDTGSSFLIYDNDKILMETDNNGNKEISYLYDQKQSQPLGMLNTGSLYNYHNDLSSVRVITDNSNNIIASYDYDTFGKITYENGNINNIYRFGSSYFNFEDSLNSYYQDGMFYDPIHELLLSRAEEYFNYLIIPHSLAVDKNPCFPVIQAQNREIGKINIYENYWGINIGIKIHSKYNGGSRNMGTIHVDRIINFFALMNIVDRNDDGDPKKGGNIKVFYKDFSTAGFPIRRDGTDHWAMDKNTKDDNMGGLGIQRWLRAGDEDEYYRPPRDLGFNDNIIEPFYYDNHVIEGIIEIQVQLRGYHKNYWPAESTKTTAKLYWWVYL